jgi:hypothetical protein
VQRSIGSGGFRQGPMSYWEAGVYDAMEIVARGYLEGRLSPPSSTWLSEDDWSRMAP